MSRLASFKGPSTPSSSPVRAPGLNNLLSPPRSADLNYKTRSLLNEFRTAASNWDQLLSNGQRSLEHLINTRTELGNELITFEMTFPPAGLVTPQIQKMEKYLHDLDNVANSSQKMFEKMTRLLDNFEQLLFDTCASKGPHWVQYEPLLGTWSLDRLVWSVVLLVRTYHQTNFTTQRLITDIRPHDTPFLKSRQILAEWIAQSRLTQFEYKDWDDVLEFVQ